MNYTTCVNKECKTLFYYRKNFNRGGYLCDLCKAEQKGTHIEPLLKKRNVSSVEELNDLLKTEHYEIEKLKEAEYKKQKCTVINPCRSLRFP